MTSEQDSALREQLRHAILGDQAHIDLKEAVGDFPAEFHGVKLDGAPHTAWQLLEHMRIAQHDILEFSRNVKHKSPKWPDEYWPKEDAPPNEHAWDKTVAALLKDRQAMQDLIADPKQDLFKAIEGGDGQTLLREALLVASHNSYHLGQLLFLKKML